MVVRTESTSRLPATEYNLTRKAGRSIIDRKPVISPDGESVLVIVENVVRVYNIRTADCARVLETEEPVNELIAIHFPENDGYNLYGCSDTGRLTVWTWENGAVLREIDLQLPKDPKILSFDLVDSNECFVTAYYPNKLPNKLCIASFSMKTGDVNYQYNSTEIVYKGILSVSLGFCQGDRYAAIGNGTKSLYIQNLIQPHLHTKIHNSTQLRIVSVAAHPTEDAVAITDTLGRVTIYRGYLFHYANLGREVLHWHYLPPLACCFPRQGSYLVTGGMEKVLVKWTVGNLANKVNEKTVIPRLPGLVKHIATNSSHIVASLTNNSIIIATAQMTVVSTILECGGLSAAARALGTSLVCHRPLGALLLGGRTGHLQICSTTSNKVLYNIDITNMNSIPNSRSNMIPLEMEVTCAAVSADGVWLVTSEYRNDGINYPEERLKFWMLQDTGTSPFKLNTCVNLSHGGSQVVSIALNNTGDFCITAGADQKFRIWKREVTQLEKTIISWSCLTACYYSSGVAQSFSHDILNQPKIRDIEQMDIRNMDRQVTPRDYMVKSEYKKTETDLLECVLNNRSTKADYKTVNAGWNRSDECDMGGVAISQDGSLIAAWFGCKLTMWDTHLCNLRTTLSHHALRPKGLQVKFGNGDAAHYVVCTTSKCLAVWSLLSLTMKWMVHIEPSCLTADPFSNRMAVVTTDNDVIVFTPHSSEPLLKKSRVLDPKSGVFVQCEFGSTSADDLRLYMMRNDSEIYGLEPSGVSPAPLEPLASRLPASNFSALLAERQASAVRTPRAASLASLHSARPHTALAQFLSAAPHMMAPVSLLCTSFLEHISGCDQPPEEPGDLPETMEVEGSSDEDEPATQTGAYKKTELWTPNYEAVKEKRLRKILSEPKLESGLTMTLFA